ncbi:MAG: 6-phosphofructokinase [Nitrospinae bacterium CG11_big_fil_rev_8_21_14_0_20_56_8]|nr:MAG: 6-phosphofructokinase [Nitrospinae bacterium CG11_big_fil_rev_8_21_14_0_20_56_8]
MAFKRVGVMTGGGDCSGLNAVIRGITRAAIIQHGASVIGIEDGYDGLIFDRHQELTVRSTRDILPWGGTILGTTNKGNPFEYKEFDESGQIVTHDYSKKAIKNFQRLMLDCLFVIGGDGTLQIAHQLNELGVPVMGIPKTIDNDLEGTDYTFGFQTAVQVASDALDRLQTTGRSHQRIMILEVMGRTAGWIALEAGIAGGAHIILIPEIPYQLDKILDKIKVREAGGSPFSVIVVAEGAREVDGEMITSEAATTRLQAVAQLGGVGDYLARNISRRTDLEVRCTVLGHTQRGGTPNSFDRILGTRLGAFAVQAAAEGKFGNMVALRTPNLELVSLATLSGKVRHVPDSSQLIQCAEAIGISLGR